MIFKDKDMASTLSYTVTIVLEKKAESNWNFALSTLPSASKIKVLSTGKAVEAEFYSKTPNLSYKEISSALSKQNISADICVQPSINRRKKLLICDMDSTLIGQECIDELAEFAGVKDSVSEITLRAMLGELGFEEALKARVALLKNLPISALDDCYKTCITLNKGARTLAHTMRENGAKAVIVSGGFTFFTQKICALAGFDDHHANILESEAGRLLGTVSHPILGRDAKLDALRRHITDIGTDSDVIAIGDGANDLAMIEAAGLGIAYYAKPVVEGSADCAIKVTDLTTALYYQGYTENEFVIR